jgi:hypothetical protein
MLIEGICGLGHQALVLTMGMVSMLRSVSGDTNTTKKTVPEAKSPSR